MKKVLQYREMIKDINLLVNTDFCAEMDMKTLPKSKPYTQEEANKMASIIGQVYLISHCINGCVCGNKYKIKNEKILQQRKEKKIL